MNLIKRRTTLEVIIIGLDNGIEIYSNNKIRYPKGVEPWNDWCEDYWNNMDKYRLHLCYWRKCWNIRAELFSAVDCSDNGLYYRMDYDAVKRFYIALERLNHKRAWENSDSIWTWKEYRDHLDQDLLNLEWLLYLMKDNPDIEVVFYDSY